MPCGLYCLPARFVWKETPRTPRNRYLTRKHKRFRPPQKKNRRKPVEIKPRWEAIKAIGLDKTKLGRFATLPKELRLMVWDHAICKPGIHFFAVVVTPLDDPSGPTDPDVWVSRILPEYPFGPPPKGDAMDALVRILDDSFKEEDTTWKKPGLNLRRGNFVGPRTQNGNTGYRHHPFWGLRKNEVCRQIRLTYGITRLVEPVAAQPVGSFMTRALSFPNGGISSYKTYESITQVSRESRMAARKSIQDFEAPLNLQLGNGKTALIDAARDLVYVKFMNWVNLPKNSIGRTPMYSRTPDLYMHRRQFYAFSGIRRVAVEVEPAFTRTCMRPTTIGRVGLCSCRTPRSAHNIRYEIMAKRLVSFLLSFPDLECVYLVFDWNEQWDLRPGRRRRFACYKQPVRLDDTACRRHYKWEKREADSFDCPGGTLREPAKPLDRLCAVVDIIHYHFHHLYPALARGKDNIKFKFLVWHVSNGAVVEQPQWV